MACRYYLNGFCRKGSNCPYLHVTSVSPSITPTNSIPLSTTPPRSMIRPITPTPTIPFPSLLSPAPSSISSSNLPFPALLSTPSGPVNANSQSFVIPSPCASPTSSFSSSPQSMNSISSWDSLDLPNTQQVLESLRQSNGISSAHTSPSSTPVPASRRLISKQEAQRSFRVGLRHYHECEFEKALGFFTQSYQLYPSKESQAMIAKTLEFKRDDGFTDHVPFLLDGEYDAHVSYKRETADEHMIPERMLKPEKENNTVSNNRDKSSSSDSEGLEGDKKQVAGSQVIKREEERQKESDRKESEKKREAERKQTEKRELEKKEAERKEVERKEAERKQQERKDVERKEVERKEIERKEAEKKEAERKEIERKENERKEVERKEVEKKEAERKALERREAIRKEAQKLAEKKEAERKEAERKEVERKEAERKEAERKETERKEAERKETERKEAERKDAERKEKEKVEKERKERERREELERRREKERREKERIEMEKREKERSEREREERDIKESEGFGVAGVPGKAEMPDNSDLMNDSSDLMHDSSDLMPELISDFMPDFMPELISDEEPYPSKAKAKRRREKNAESLAVVKQIRNASNYYAALNISQDADSETIHAQYKSIMQLLHASDETGASLAAIVKQVTQAYTILADEKKRMEYDKEQQEEAGAEEEEEEEDTNSATSSSSSSSSSSDQDQDQDSDVEPAAAAVYTGGFIDSARMFMAMVVLAVIAIGLFIRQGMTTVGSRLGVMVQGVWQWLWHREPRPSPRESWCQSCRIYHPLSPLPYASRESKEGKEGKDEEGSFWEEGGRYYFLQGSTKHDVTTIVHDRYWRSTPDNPCHFCRAHSRMDAANSTTHDDQSNNKNKKKPPTNNANTNISNNNRKANKRKKH